MIKILIAVTLLVGLVAAEKHGSMLVKAKARIRPDCKKAFPYRVHGTVKITQKKDGGIALFRVRLSGLPPNTTHGFHVHEGGDIHTRGCLSTHGHYNPIGRTHGAPSDAVRHVGDLGNLHADSKGKVSVVFADKLAGLVGNHSIAGRAFVLHAKSDDMGRGKGKLRAGSLKTGNAGSRVACGTIYYL